MDINKAAHHAGSVDLARIRLHKDGKSALAQGCADAAQFIRDLMVAETRVPSGVEAPRMLVLSTSHVTEATAQALDAVNTYVGRPDTIPLFYPKGEVGWIFPLVEDHPWTDACPEDLKVLRTLAEHIGASWIMLDRDAETVAGLPVYDW
jgi:hypothetical protein